MRKLKGLIIMLCISLSLFGVTACSDGGANSYEQITPEQAKTIMDTNVKEFGGIIDWPYEIVK